MTDLPPMADLVALDLTEDERSYLAMHAIYAGQREIDPRYGHGSYAGRLDRRRRWQQIANVLYPEIQNDPNGTCTRTDY